MKKSSVEKSDNEKISKAKSDMSMNIIKYNHAVDEIMRKMADALVSFNELSSSFDNQRELKARKKMNERVINSALRMLSGNKLQLWMIDDRSLEEDDR